MDTLAMHLPRRTFGTKVSSGRELDEFNSDLKSKYQYWWRVLQRAARGNLNPDWFAKPRLMEPLLRLIATEDEIKCLILANERSNILSQPQPEPEPELKLEPKSEPEWESKPEPEIELDTEIPLELNPEIEPKLEPKPGPEPKPEPELTLEQEPELEWDMTLDLELKTEFKMEFKTEFKTDSDLEFDSRNLLMTTADVCREYDPFEFPLDESNNGMEYWCEEPPNKRSRVYSKCKRSPFIEEEYGNRILTSFVCFSSSPCTPKPIRCVAQKRTYDEMNPLDELLELRRNAKLMDPTPSTPTRSILKSQCNVNNVISSYSNSNQSCQPLSDHQEKKVYQQNQDDQKEMIMKFHKQIMIGYQERKENPSTKVKELLSSGSSPKTETDTESEDSVNFQHDQILTENLSENVTEKLSQYLSEGAMASTRPMMNNNSVLINKVRRHWRKDEETQRQIEDDIKRNTLSDHCYHLNEPQSMDRLGLNELSESEEEDVDVESFENPSYLNFTPLKRNAQPVAKVDMATSLRRPRGRPPGPNSAKRKNVRVNQAPLPAHTPASTPRRIGRPAGRRQNYRQSRGHLDEEEVEKRSLHNNMERQRRIGLKMLFEDLKSQVPSIANNEKVSKVLILKQAKEYVSSLGVIKNNYEPELRKLQKQQQLLKKKLEALRDLSR